MTDEEMAENWIAEYTGVDVETQKAIQLQYHKNLKQAFLAGLKAGRPQWHYLTENPNDLPKDEKDVQVLYQDCDKINTYNCVYDIHAENWLYYNLDNMVLELFPYNVIAWEEIVLPKESE